jgi:hypothetical protein
MKLIVYKAHADHYRWRLVDSEGAFLEQSELIESFEDCLAQTYKKAYEAGDGEPLEVENRVVRGNE